MPKKFLTVKEVSKIIGVTPLTVRNWDKKGQLIAYRNPMNNYRLYKTEDVEGLLGQIEQGPSKEVQKQKIRKLKIEVENL